MEKVILVGVRLPVQSDESFRSSLEELMALTETANGEVAAVLTQSRQRIDAATYIGKGKLQELKTLAKTARADAIIFNSELSPSQQSRLSAQLDVKVLDRTQLILDIFAMRAISREGKLQVECAQLQYLLPRLSGMGEALSRLGGGIGTRGPGETKLESDRRYIRKRISDVKNQLSAVVRHRARYRERRLENDQFQIALVGYTNAGKSTLFNRLTSANSFEENRLFATLDPLTRKMKCPNGFGCLLSDTVGFIQDLPTQLIAAFRSTLEEVVSARLIVHVIDASDPDALAHEATVLRLLSELGADKIPVLTVYNKKDRLKTAFITPKDALLISAFDMSDMDSVRLSIQSRMTRQMVAYHKRIDAKEGQLIAAIKTRSIVTEQRFLADEQAYDFTGYVLPDSPLAALLGKEQF